MELGDDGVAEGNGNSGENADDVVADPVLGPGGEELSSIVEAIFSRLERRDGPRDPGLDGPRDEFCEGGPVLTLEA